MSCTTSGGIWSVSDTSASSGRSRSVSLVALYLHKQQPDRYPTLDDAVAVIRERRELRPDEWFETPKPSLYEAARRASDWIDMIEGRKKS